MSRRRATYQEQAPVTDAEVVPSYGSIALRRWAEGERQHRRTLCECLTCSDGRKMAGMPPLIRRRLVPADQGARA